MSTENKCNAKGYMENLKMKYDELIKIHRVLEVAVKRYQEILIDESIDLDTRESIRDSLIKRFELMYDFLLKYLRKYIITARGVAIDSPRKVFQQCLSLGLTDEEETEELVGLIKYRKLTAHAYDSDVANKVADDIQKHHDAIRVIIEKVSLDTLKK